MMHVCVLEALHAKNIIHWCRLLLHVTVAVYVASEYCE